VAFVNIFCVSNTILKSRGDCCCRLTGFFYENPNGDVRDENLLHSISNNGIIYDGTISNVTREIQVGTNIPIVNFNLSITAQIPDNGNFPEEIRGKTLVWEIPYSIRTLTELILYPDCMSDPGTGSRGNFKFYMGAF
jgi:hypothetical protein